MSGVDVPSSAEALQPILSTLSPTLLEKIVSFMDIAEATLIGGANKKKFVLEELKKVIPAEEFKAVEALAQIAIDVIAIATKARIDLSKINPLTLCEKCGPCCSCCSSKGCCKGCAVS